MPAYPWLAERTVDAGGTAAKMRALRSDRRAVHGRGDRRRRGRGARQDRDGCADRLSAGPRHGLGELVSDCMDIGHIPRHRHAACCSCCSSGWSIWAWSKARRADFDAAARLPLEDDGADTESMTTRGTAFSSSCSPSRNIAGCLWLLWWTRRSPRRGSATADNHRPRLGRGPARAEQSAAALVAVAVHHHRACSACVYLALYPGLGNFAGTLGWTLAQRARGADRASTRERIERRWRRSRAQPSRELARDPAALDIGRNLFLQQLRDLPRLRWRRRAGLSQPRRQGLAVGRRRRHRRRDHRGWPHRRDAAAGAKCSARSGVEDVLATCVSLQRPQAAGRRLRAPAAAKFATLCAACHGADGARQPAARRAESHRRRLAARRRARRGARDASRRAATAPCRRMRRGSARRASNCWRLTCCRCAAGTSRRRVARRAAADERSRATDSRASSATAAAPSGVGRSGARSSPPRWRTMLCFALSRSAWRSRDGDPPPWWTTACTVYALGFFFFWLIGLLAATLCWSAGATGPS